MSAQKLLLTFLAVLPSVAGAQEVVGRSIIRGAAVELLSDGTWRFTEEGERHCLSLGQGFNFCGDPNVWSAVPPGSSEVTAAVRKDNRRYAQFIVEDVGAQDGVTRELMRETVLLGAAGARGGRVEDVPVLDLYEATILGVKGETIVYEVRNGLMRVVFMNTIVIQEGSTAQFMTYEIGPDYDESDRALHQEMLALLSMDG